MVLDFGWNNCDLTLPADASTQVSAFRRFPIFTLEKSLKTFYTKTIWPEELKLLWKHPRVLLIQVSSNHDP